MNFPVPQRFQAAGPVLPNTSYNYLLYVTGLNDTGSVNDPRRFDEVQSNTYLAGEGLPPVPVKGNLQGVSLLEDYQSLMLSLNQVAQNFHVRDNQDNWLVSKSRFFSFSFNSFIGWPALVLETGKKATFGRSFALEHLPHFAKISTKGNY